MNFWRQNTKKYKGNTNKNYCFGAKMIFWRQNTKEYKGNTSKKLQAKRIVWRPNTKKYKGNTNKKSFLRTKLISGARIQRNTKEIQ